MYRIYSAMENQQPNFRVYIASDGLRFYIGCQTGTDTEYLGSSSDKSFKPVYKFIVGHYSSREEAGKAEIDLIRSMNAIKDPMFVNKAIVPVKSLEELREYTLSSHVNDLTLKERISESVKELWQDPDYISKQKECKEKLSKRMEELWQDEEFRSTQSERISEAMRSSEIRKSEEYKARERENCRRGAEGSKKFFANLKQDPEAYKKFMEARGKKISEGRARRRLNGQSESS